MVLPAAPRNSAASVRAPMRSRIAQPVALRARRIAVHPPQADRRLPFGITFTGTFPFISFGDPEPETTAPTPTPAPTPPVAPTPVPVEPTPTAEPVPTPVSPTSGSPFPPTPTELENSTELGEVRLPVIGLKVSQAFPNLKELREAFGPMLPTDIEYTEVDPANPALKGMSFLSSYDEGFCGHFTVPGKKDEGAAATFQKVMAQSDPFRFIQDNLRATPAAGRNDINSDELVIFTPGLRTMHAQKGSQETAPSRLQHYANTLGCPLAQLHIGTDVDQGDVELEVSLALRGLLRAAGQQLKDAGLTPKEVKGGTLVYAREQRDKLEAGLTVIGFTRPLWQSHMIDLLKWNEGPKRPLVIMPYSRTAVELTTTLKNYIAGYEGGKAEAEALLRKTLTVVTLGNGTKPYGWPDGPAYVHVGGWSEDQEGPPPKAGSSPVRGTDPGVFYEGVHAGARENAGADATFVHSDWVWSTGEAHNFASAGSASLRLVMAMNNVTGFRQLYDRLSTGEVLKKPTFEQVKAAIALTDSQDFMWNKSRAPWEGVGELPSKDEAQKMVGEWM